jgi:type I restriction enzyme M protein
MRPDSLLQINRDLTEEALRKRILVASYWWRQPYLEALREFADAHNCELYTLGDLIDAGHLEVFQGHGSPNSHYINRGTVPYVKVVDIKNWRVIENPKYAIPEDVAAALRRGRNLHAFDLVTPTRASKNIGMFGVIMPWQTNVVLTREIAVWRVNPNSELLDRWLLLALMSLKVVHDQFRFLVLMQMNREDLGDRYREILLPIPRSAELRETWSGPVREYLSATAQARQSYELLLRQLSPEHFIDRP